jgi:hypothetical protein
MCSSYCNQIIEGLNTWQGLEKRIHRKAFLEISWKGLLGVPGFGWKDEINIKEMHFEDTALVKVLII